MQQRTFDGEGHRECEQPLPSALGSVISGLGGSNEAELAIVAGGVFPTTSGPFSRSGRAIVCIVGHYCHCITATDNAHARKSQHEPAKASRGLAAGASGIHAW